MDTRELIAQIIGIVAMVFIIFSYQGKKQSSVITMQLVGSLFFGVNYLLLGAYVGALLNVMGVVRAVVFLFKEKLRADKWPWLVGFSLCYIATYVLNFTVLGKAPTVFNLLIELLPVVGMVALNIGYMLKDAADVRKCGLVSSPAWLIYNIVIGSWGAILCEVFSLISIVVGIWRLDRKKK